MTDVIELEAPIIGVTVLEDRAHVRRRAQVSVPSGRSRIQVANLSPVLADKTLVAGFGAAAGVRALDTSVTRREIILDEEKAADQRALDDRIEALEREQAERARHMERLERRRGAIAAWSEAAIEEITDDARWDRADAEGWYDTLAALDGREEELDDRLAELRRRHEEGDTALADLIRRRTASETPATTMRAAAAVEIEADAASQTELTLEYVVPAACWRPYHTARWLDDVVEVSTDACVWQNTGEDWTKVELSLSTERPSLGTTPPVLTSDVLRATKKGPEVEVETREQEIQTAGLGGAPTVRVAEVPGIDDGGQAQVLRAPHPATVPSDGHPYRVFLGAFTSAATGSLVLMAELAPAVILRSEQTNEGGRPLLPGPVDLVRNGGLAGRTTLEYVAPNARFELGWGPEGSLRVARRVRELEEEKRMLSSWMKLPRVVEIFLSNIGKSSQHVEVTERVLVSEIEKVKVTTNPKKTTDGATPDRDGFVRWKLDVPPNGKRSLRLTYTVEKHADVVGVL